MSKSRHVSLLRKVNKYLVSPVSSVGPKIVNGDGVVETLQNNVHSQLLKCSFIA